MLLVHCPEFEKAYDNFNIDQSQLITCYLVQHCFEAVFVLLHKDGKESTCGDGGACDCSGAWQACQPACQPVCALATWTLDRHLVSAWLPTGFGEVPNQRKKLLRTIGGRTAGISEL